MSESETKKHKVTPLLVEEVKQKLADGVKETEVRRYVRESLGLSKSRGNEVYNEIIKDLKNVETYGLSFASSKFIYNSDLDTYIINLKCRLSPLTISGSKHRAICRAYSQWGEDLTCNEVCVRFSLTPEVFSEYRRVFNLTKEREPLSAEEVVKNTVEESVEAILEEKRYKVYQQFEHENWKDIQLKARKWEEVSFKTIDSIRNVLNEWTPPKLEFVPKKKEVEGLKFLSGLVDNHIGEVFNRNKAMYGRDFNSEIACKIIDDYSQRIYQTIKNRSEKFSEGIIFVSGDFIHSCIAGHTRKGTRLESDKIDEEMFRIGLDTMIRFIDNFRKLFPKVRAFSQPGNHDSLILNYLMMAVEKYFAPDQNIEFNISESWMSFYRIGNVAVITTHGGHDKLRVSLPAGTKLKVVIQELLLNKVDEIQGCTSKILLAGHRHAFSQSDLGSFEFYCLGSSVLSDNYAQDNGWNHSPRQNCLILDQNHVVETLHYYF